MSTENQKAKLLGAFLKSRREKLSPPEAGLPAGYGKRRTPGLRREEVAQLAHVSTTWYTWLEQGRAAAPSRQVMDSVARALQLDDHEHQHLLHLASLDLPAGDRAEEAEAVSPDLARLVAQLPGPAFVATDSTEVLCWNEQARRVICDFPSFAREDRYMAWLTFMDGRLRRSIVNWDAYAGYTVAVLRGRYDRNLRDAGFQRLIERLLAASPDFKALWDTHDVAEKSGRSFGLRHPERGELSFAVNTFSQINGNANIHCCIFVPAEGTGTEERLRDL
ncbi:Helix-turn-helix domain-containing protein [Paenibacillus sp. UNC496MF]|uniref:helix-turn-helix transcriptional regulator n=1 Tax=Paenibacillus sp. UNC496MF TaxID=1502753 RepID=UPI0008DEF218|nr:helix-turn-helix transcriptional regulator [Paenibacillus sp. UNC496MF]SFI78111.1 Helix-turn-helix domain-containing protein [Paenibacillus sp. UNC496MF]